MPLTPNLAKYLSILPPLETLPDERKDVLKALITYIIEKRQKGEPVKLTFICTHNSRRSHLGQIWAQVAAYYYGIEPVDCFSGGTETTACNPRTVAAMQRAGFDIQAVSEGDNPFYLIRYADGMHPLLAFSKVYDQKPNPERGFAAVMTCSHAEENCPFIPGTERRIAVMYEDPKVSDGTPQESAVYDERCRQIAQEMMYVFEQVRNNTLK
ncbi:MAG: protein-tyrosine-phosphatase [Saprospiraceae bacterium]|nr:protein-tyrosine-phosphatase [Saprospiraceae bacterium]